MRSVTENGEIQTTEDFVRQVVDKIQGVIEAKLTTPPTFSYPCLIYSIPKS